MNRMQANWKTQTPKEKFTLLLVLAMGAIVIVCAILGLIGVLPPKTANLCLVPAMGILSLVNGLVQIKKNRKVGILLLVCAGIILTCAVIILALTIINP